MLDIANVPKPLEALGSEYVIACGLAIKEYE
jgi:hypothetical protein